MNCHDETAEVCARVEQVLKALPIPTDTSREEIFERHNLWSEEIRSTCNQVIEHYKSTVILVGQDLYRPAAALSRSIHEACFRFEYLSRNKCELQDWTEWQMSQDYQFIKDFLQFEATVSTSNKQNLGKQLKGLVDAFGGPPTQRRFPWKANGVILAAIASGMSDGYKQRLRRLLYDYPSRYVHIRGVGLPSPESVVGSSPSLLTADPNTCDGIVPG